MQPGGTIIDTVSDRDSWQYILTHHKPHSLQVREYTGAGLEQRDQPCACVPFHSEPSTEKAQRNHV